MGSAYNGNCTKEMPKGDLVSQIDGDDRWLPRKLELEWKALQEYPETQIAYSNVYTIDTKGNRTGIWYDGKGPVPPSGDVFVDVYSKSFFRNNSSLFRNYLIYRSAMEAVGSHDLKLESYWDWDEKIRLSSRFQVAYSGAVLVEYRSHEGGISKSRPEMHFRAAVNVYEKNLPLLRNRTQSEAIFIKCNVESLLASLQKVLPLSHRKAYYSAHNVYDRNLKLIDKLSKQDRELLKKKLSLIFTQLELQASEEEIKRGNKQLALKYFLKSLRNPNALLKLATKLTLKTLLLIKLKL